MQWSNAENMTGACISNMKPQGLSVLKAYLLKWGNVLETFSHGFLHCIGTILKLQRCQPSLRREIGKLTETPFQGLASLYSGQELKRNLLNQPHKVSRNVSLTMALRDFLVWSNPFIYRWRNWDLGAGELFSHTVSGWAKIRTWDIQLSNWHTSYYPHYLPSNTCAWIFNVIWKKKITWSDE